MRSDTSGAGMRVGFDATPCLCGSTGVARYTSTLLAELRRQEVDARPFAVGRGAGDLPPSTRHLGVPLRVVQPLWARGLPPRAERLAGGCDLVHSTDLVAPSTGVPLVATIHDLAALDRPDLHPPRALEQLTRRLDRLDRAAVVLPNSHATAADLQRHGVRTRAVRVVYHFAPPAPAGTIPAGEPGPYLLAVGELTARKDYPTMLRALATEPARSLRLVIVGPVGFQGDELPALADRLGIAERVRFAGRVSDEVLAGLYAGATALCLTSVIEGFGVPLVEAMRAGLPIVASDLDVVREIAAGAVRTVPVGDHEGFGEALAAVAGDAALREQLGAAGRARARDFDVAKTAAGTIEAYREVLG